MPGSDRPGARALITVLNLQSRLVATHPDHRPFDCGAAMRLDRYYTAPACYLGTVTPPRSRAARCGGLRGLRLSADRELVSAGTRTATHDFGILAIARARRGARPGPWTGYMTYSADEFREKLRESGLSVTAQRLALGRLIFSNGDRHVNAEQLRAEAETEHVKVSLATIYNTLRQFAAAGLLREVAVDAGRSYFDTNLTEHHHFFHEDEGRLEDIPAGSLRLSALPAAPDGMGVQRVDVIVRIRHNA